MDWIRLLAYISGSVDQELLLRNEYLIAENRIVRKQIKGRLPLTDGERNSLAEIGKRLGRKAFQFERIRRKMGRSIKEECLSNVILFGERSLRHAIGEYVEHYHRERNHQGRGNALLYPVARSGQKRGERITCRERLGGLLRYYYSEAA